MVFTEQDLAQVTTFYYLYGNTENSFAALEYILNSPLLDHFIETGPYGPIPYFFYRIAQIDNKLWDKYAELFERVSNKQRIFILWIYAYGNNVATEKYLSDWKNGERFKEIQNDINTSIESEYKGANVLQIEKPRDANDLDLLWTEFIATGNLDAVKMIIDVFEWKDLIRDNLENWFKEHSPQKRTNKNDTLNTQYMNLGVVLDFNTSRIYSGQDLDCAFSMNGCNYDNDRFEASKVLLPFDLSDDDIVQVAIKASAKWSLCSNAQTHSSILDLCVQEAEKRTGRCRIVLLEMISYAFSERKDLANQINYFIQSLTAYPEKRTTEIENAEAVYKKLQNLYLDTNKSLDDSVSLQNIISRFDSAVIDLKKYRSRMIWKEAGSQTDSESITWDLELIIPDRFRVSQTAGSDYDEWIITGSHYYRGPMYADYSDNELFEADSGISRMLTLDGYKKFLTKMVNSASHYAITSQSDYFVIDFNDIDPTILDLFNERLGEFDLELLRICFDKKLNYISKVEITIKIEEEDNISGNLEIIHMFTGFNDDISVYPPPFAIIDTTSTTDGSSQERDKLANKRTKIRAYGALIGVFLGFVNSYLLIDEYNTNPVLEYLVNAAVMGLFYGLAGLVVAEITRWFLPSQRTLRKIENDREYVPAKSGKLSDSIESTHWILIWVIITSLFALFRSCGE